MQGVVLHRGKKGITVFLLVLLLLISCLPVSSKAKDVEEKQKASMTDALTLTAESAVLLEPYTGTVLYEKEKDKVLKPASVTKIMTLLLIMEAMQNKQFTYDDTVMVSAHAASMGGSQVFLEEGETQTVKDMLKCIVVSSANDACVAMAEYVAGSEEAFVDQMNKRAEALGMKHTHFVNACGLDAKGHVTTAYDIALMARELTVKHPEIFEFTTIWMDTITHKTVKGTKEFGLSNTNKLIRHYEGATGLKTGSTSEAKFCLCATASRKGLDLISVVMACPDYKARQKDAAALLDYGFGSCRLYKDEVPLAKTVRIPVSAGKKKTVAAEGKEPFYYVLSNGKEHTIRKKVTCKKQVSAPVKKGTKVGTVSYYDGKKKIGESSIIATQTVKPWNYWDCFKQVTTGYMLTR